MSGFVGWGRIGARAAAVAHVAGEAAVLLVVGARGPDVDPLRAEPEPVLAVLAAGVPAAFLDRVHAELGGDLAPGDALRLEAGVRVVRLRFRGRALLVGVCRRAIDDRRLLVRPLLGLDPSRGRESKEGDDEGKG